MLEALLRELAEEIGYTPTVEQTVEIEHIYKGNEYSQHDGQEYNLYILIVNERPEITISWEHAGYDWVTKDEFITKARAAIDTFMHMAADALEKYKQRS